MTFSQHSIIGAEIKANSIFILSVNLGSPMNLITFATVSSISNHQCRGHVKLDLMLSPEMITKIFPQFKCVRYNTVKMAKNYYL